MLDTVQRAEVEHLIRSVGLNCIAPYFRNLHVTHIRYKQPGTDPVSVADEEAEELLRTGLEKILPGSLFVGEESYAKNPGILSRLLQPDTPVWVVDPIDGTNNFIKGREGFGILVCLVMNEDILSSWHFNISAKSMIVSYRGEGITVNGEAYAPPPKPAGPLTGYLGWRLYKYPAVQHLKNTSKEFVLLPAQDPSIVSYRKLLTGELDFLVYRLTYPWDHLAGIALIKEAGGCSERWGRQAVRVTDTHNGLVVARSEDIMTRVQTDIVRLLSQSSDILKMGT
jgi:fructose-1,6-bisphosphatase/inositol monophosphatase family enzyme